MLVFTTLLFSVLGSALMIEANFSPHFILLTIILPYIGILPLEVLFKWLLRSRQVLFSMSLIALVIPWTVWNYNNWIRVDNFKSDINTWLLRLPIQRERIKSLATCSSYRVDIGESMYPLMYPLATRQRLTAENPVGALSDFLEKESCPCLVLFEKKQEEVIKAWLK